MTDKAAILPNDKGMMIVAKDEKALGRFMGAAQRELAKQAIAASRFTGLSIGFCSTMVLHRAMKRIAKA